MLESDKKKTLPVTHSTSREDEFDKTYLLSKSCIFLKRCFSFFKLLLRHQEALYTKLPSADISELLECFLKMGKMLTKQTW